MLMRTSRQEFTVDTAIEIKGMEVRVSTWMEESESSRFICGQYLVATRNSSAKGCK